MYLPYHILLDILKQLSYKDRVNFLLALGHQGQTLAKIIPARSFSPESDLVLVLISTPGLRFGGNPNAVLFEHRITSTLPHYPWQLPRWMKGLIARYRPQSPEAPQRLKQVLRVYAPSNIVLMGDPPNAVLNVLFEFLHSDIQMLRSSSEAHLATNIGPYLQHFTLSRLFLSGNAATLMNWAAPLPISITELVLAESNVITDGLVGTIIQNHPQLEILDMRFCNNVTMAAVLQADVIINGVAGRGLLLKILSDSVWFGLLPNGENEIHQHTQVMGEPLCYSIQFCGALTFVFITPLNNGLIAVHIVDSDEEESDSSFEESE